MYADPAAEVGHRLAVRGPGGPTSIGPRLCHTRRAAKNPCAAGQAGGAVFRAGLKNGVGTTTALTRWRAASTVTSISSPVPVAHDGASTVASAISFFSTGDHVVDVAFPTCRPPRYTGTGTREAVVGTCVGSPSRE